MQFVIAALTAGQINSGINAVYVLAYLAFDPYWMARTREEVEQVLQKYCHDKEAPLSERLAAVPLKAWETEFETTQLCLRDTVRLQLGGTAFRRNIGGRDIEIGDEIIPDGAFAVRPPVPLGLTLKSDILRGHIASKHCDLRPFSLVRPLMTDLQGLSNRRRSLEPYYLQTALHMGSRTVPT